jgi:hypothetical protein
VLLIEEEEGGGDRGDAAAAHGVCDSSSTVIVQDTRVDEGLGLGLGLAQVDLYSPLDSYSSRLLAIEGSATEDSWLLEAVDWCEHLLYKAFNYCFSR